MCTASVCSCYAPSRDFNKEGEESSRSNHNSLGAPSEKKDWGKEEVPYNELHGRENSNGHMEQHSLKSNLKKTTEPEDNNQFKTEKRKVCWPDAHGKDIAHVHEFEPSMSEEGELEEVRNSCICAIQ